MFVIIDNGRTPVDQPVYVLGDITKTHCPHLSRLLLFLLCWQFSVFQIRPL